MKIIGKIEHLGGNNYKVKDQPFTCDSDLNRGVTTKIRQFAVQKVKLEVWLRDDNVLLGVKLK